MEARKRSPRWLRSILMRSDGHAMTVVDRRAVVQSLQIVESALRAATAGVTAVEAAPDGNEESFRAYHQRLLGERAEIVHRKLVQEQGIRTRAAATWEALDPEELASAVESKVHELRASVWDSLLAVSCDLLREAQALRVFRTENGLIRDAQAGASGFMRLGLLGLIVVLNGIALALYDFQSWLLGLVGIGTGVAAAITGYGGVPYAGLSKVTRRRDEALRALRRLREQHWIDLRAVFAEHLESEHTVA